MTTEHSALIETLLLRRTELGEAIQELANPATRERIVDISAHRQFVGGKTQLTVELTRIEAALSRNAKGLFGLCCSCELDVETERLARDPTVAFCEACFEEVAEERRRQGYVVR